MKFGVIVFPGSNCDHDAFYAVAHNLEQPVEFIWHEQTSVKGLVRGTIEDLRRVFSAAQRHNLRFEIVVVQPGISASKLREMPEQLLVTTKHSALAAGFARYCVIGSK